MTLRGARSAYIDQRPLASALTRLSAYFRTFWFLVVSDWALPARAAARRGHTNKADKKVRIFIGIDLGAKIMQKLSPCKRSCLKAECIVELRYVQEIVKLCPQTNTNRQKIDLFSTFNADRKIF